MVYHILIIIYRCRKLEISLRTTHISIPFKARIQKVIKHTSFLLVRITKFLYKDDIYSELCYSNCPTSYTCHCTSLVKLSKCVYYKLMNVSQLMIFTNDSSVLGIRICNISDQLQVFIRSYLFTFYISFTFPNTPSRIIRYLTLILYHSLILKLFSI